MSNLNRHGHVMLWSIWKVGGAFLGPGNEVYSARRWLITPTHTHHATDDIIIGTLEEVREKLRALEPQGLCVGAYMDDPDDLVETWVCHFGDDARVPQ